MAFCGTGDSSRSETKQTSVGICGEKRSLSAEIHTMPESPVKRLSINAALKKELAKKSREVCDLTEKIKTKDVEHERLKYQMRNTTQMLQIMTRGNCHAEILKHLAEKQVKEIRNQLQDRDAKIEALERKIQIADYSLEEERQRK
ncbi:hypothetical protein BS50DRAFT_680658 [Corynespora cassiicola Philippines]|uniref:Uncharacterized protein n=1 Tax=Corynespora cassiicola Philippines TaxID=1448308 RepID=A0A2T2N8E4_CORCC|nr:hypothetical protein BS50DRAFT_680658 [Corynespora cassiicola Philippines]